MWVDDNTLTDFAAATSVTQRSWFISWSYTVEPGTLGWISVRIVRVSEANFSGLNVHNLISRTYVYSEDLTNMRRSSTTVICQCIHACNKYINNMIQTFWISILFFSF